MPIRIEGKFFQVGDKKFYVKGVTYGPFAPNEAGEHFPGLEQARRDLAQVVELNANTIRVYHGSPRWLLDLAEERGL
jgi:hypothetical protein